MEPLGNALARIRPRRLAGQTDAAQQLEPETPPACPICKDFGFVRKDVALGDPDFGRAITCTCRQGEVRDRLRRRSQVGALADRRFDNFRLVGRGQLSEQDKRRLASALDGCSRYAEKPEFWLLLCGP